MDPRLLKSWLLTIEIDKEQNNISISIFIQEEYRKLSCYLVTFNKAAYNAIYSDVVMRAKYYYYKGVIKSPWETP